MHPCGGYINISNCGYLWLTAQLEGDFAQN